MNSRKILKRRNAHREEADEEIEYVVQHIVDKRIVNGKVQYYLKWEGYPCSQNTWEPIENINCTDLIQAYEESIKTKKTETKKCNEKPKQSVDGGKNNGETIGLERGLEPEESINTKNTETKKCNEEPKSENNNGEPIGFEVDLEPEKILGATDSTGELMFLVKWKGVDESDLVLAKKANIKWPQVVIDFYEKILTWDNVEEPASYTVYDPLECINL